jgi:competence protein ComEA
MNVKYLALCLSLSVVPLSVQAVSSPNHSSVKQAVVVKSKIDLNTAGLSALTGSFKGIGKKRAAAIIAYRESHHGFKSIEELASVKGFGQHFLEVNKNKLKEVFTVN